MKTHNWSIPVIILLVLSFAFSLSAQKRGGVEFPTLAEDTFFNPHDFSNEFYAENGVNPKTIIDRRTGFDFLSVISFSSNPIHRNVRVLATLPAYGVNGEILFWSPLGKLNDDSFTDDGVGIETREMANTYPVYIFPKKNVAEDAVSFINNRQAAIIDETQTNFYVKRNPLSLRLILVVNFTEKALNTKEGIVMLGSMAKKNGVSLDGTPLIKTMDDMALLSKYEFISIQKREFREDPAPPGRFVISPVIYEPVKGVIAPDAFLMTVTQDGEPLPGESFFTRQFSCLQKTRNWCSE